MIDEAKARAAVEDMNQAGLKNLLRAMAVEKHLFQLYAFKELETSYSPPMATMVVEILLWQSKTLVNLAEAIRTAVHEKPRNVTYFGDKMVGRSGMRMTFEGGFAVLVRRSTRRI